MDYRVIKPGADYDYFVVNPHDVLPPDFSGRRAGLLEFAESNGWGGAEFEKRLEELEAFGGRVHLVVTT